MTAYVGGTEMKGNPMHTLSWFSQQVRDVNMSQGRETFLSKESLFEAQTGNNQIEGIVSTMT